MKTIAFIPSLLAARYISSKSSLSRGSPPVNRTLRQPRDAASARMRSTRAADISLPRAFVSPAARLI